jgi:hypothetical protein
MAAERFWKVRRYTSWTLSEEITQWGFVFARAAPKSYVKSFAKGFKSTMETDVSISPNTYCAGLRCAMEVIEEHIQNNVREDSEYHSAVAFHLWMVKKDIGVIERWLTGELYAVSKLPGQVWEVYRGVGDNTDDDKFLGRVRSLELGNKVVYTVNDSSAGPFTSLREAMEYLDTPPSERGFRWPRGEHNESSNSV